MRRVVRRKRCSKCGENKPVELFSIDNRRLYGRASYCKQCHTELTRDWFLRNPEYRQDWRKGQGRAKDLVSMARSRAKQRGIECTISDEDIFIPDFCPILGIPIVRGSGTKLPGSASIDRMDNSQGYAPGNVQVISDLANRMKQDATPEQLLAFADWVHKVYGGGLR